MAKRDDKAAKRKRKLTARSAKRAAATPAHHWDTLFGQAIRFAMHHMEDRTETDIVRFLARGRLMSGVRVLKAFLDTAPLSPAEVAVVRGWTALQPSLFECLEHRGTVLVVRDLTTWITSSVAIVHPAAAAAFDEVPYGVMIALPTPDGLVLGGEVRGVRRAVGRREVLSVAANLCRTYPRLCQRAHPDVVEKMLADEGAAFERTFGARHLLVEPGQLADVFATFGEAYQGCTVDGFQSAGSFGVEPNESTVGVLHHPAYGFVVQPGLDDFLSGVQAGNVLTVEGWLKDGTVSPAVLDLAAELHPESFDTTLSAVVGRTVHWPRARTDLIATYKPRYVRPIPHLYPVPSEVAAAFVAQLPSDGLGLNALLGLEF